MKGLVRRKEREGRVRVVGRGCEEYDNPNSFERQYFEDYSSLGKLKDYLLIPPS